MLRARRRSEPCSSDLVAALQTLRSDAMSTTTTSRLSVNGNDASEEPVEWRWLVASAAAIGAFAALIASDLGLAIGLALIPVFVIVTGARGA